MRACRQCGKPAAEHAGPCGSPPPPPELHPQRASAAAAITALVGKPRAKPNGQRKMGKRSVERAIVELAALRASGEWREARPAHFVALYAWCHEQVYGVAPAELDGAAWLNAASAAARMMRAEFDGDGEALAEFMRWVWRREQAREKRRRAQQRDDVWRVSWRAMFTQRFLLTDYRIDRARRHE